MTDRLSHDAKERPVKKPGDEATADAMRFYLDDRVLIAGRAWNGTDYDFALARFPNEFIPTAANESISGRVATQKGGGIGNAIMTATNSRGEIRTARTNSFGFYRFDDLRTGETYVVTVTAKRYRFNEPSRVVLLNEVVVGLDFVATP